MIGFRKKVVTSASLALMLLSGNAFAREPLGSHQEHFLPSLGVRTALIADQGYDPFATNDVFTQVTIGFSRTVLVIGELSLAADLHWDYGERSGEARGAATELEVHRLALGPELRYHVLPVLYGFSRISPALLRNSASLQDEATDSPLHARGWAFGLDATLGVAAQLYGARSGASNVPRIWGSVEAGYGFGAPTDLSFTADDHVEVPMRSAPVELGELSMSGPLLRVSAAVSF